MERPDDVSLEQNFPNPFNPTTTIRYRLPAAGRLSITVFNAMGQPVRRLVDRSSHPMGIFETFWNATDDRGYQVASGVYFYRLNYEDKTLTKRMILVK